MRSVKMLGLAAVAAMALTAVAGTGSASATILTCTEPAGVKMQCPVGTRIDASVEGGTIKLTNTIIVTCTNGTVKGSIATAGSATETPTAFTEEVSFELPTCDCGTTCNCESIEQITNGTLEVHTENNGTTANNNGTLTGSGVTFHIVCAGVTCNYITGNKLDLGTLTGSSNTLGTATLDISTTLTKQAGSSFLCATSVPWEGNYKVTSPDWVDVD